MPKVHKQRKHSKAHRESDGRQLMPNNLKLPERKIRGGSDWEEHEFVEYIGTVYSKQQAEFDLLQLHPSDSVTFPALAGRALQYEKYRFLSLQIEYVPGCPATQSGALGMVMKTEYTDNPSSVDDSIPSIASYEFGAGGTVTLPLRTKRWEVKEPREYYTDTAMAAENGVLNVFQATLVWMSAASSSADHGKLAGYIRARYVIRFSKWRPTREVVLNEQNFHQQNFPTSDIVVPRFTETSANLGNFTKQSYYPSSGVQAGGDIFELVGNNRVFQNAVRTIVSGLSAEALAKTRVKETDTGSYVDYYSPAVIGHRGDSKSSYAATKPMATGDVQLTIWAYNNALDGNKEVAAKGITQISGTPQDLSLYVTWDVTESLFPNYDPRHPVFVWYTVSQNDGDGRHVIFAEHNILGTGLSLDNPNVA